MKNKFIFQNDYSEKKYIESKTSVNVVTTLKEFKEFYKVQWVVYEKDNNFVPELWTEIRDFFKIKNPFWDHAETRLFTIKKNSKTLGRIAAIIDYNINQYKKEKIGYFGFFECIDDYKIASQLFKEAEEWLHSKDITIFRGPINGRVDFGCGFLSKGFDFQPFLLSSYSPKYYLDFSEKYGLKNIRDQITYHIDLKKPMPEYLKKAAKKCKKDNVVIRKFDRFGVNKELNWWIKLFMETFSDHWGYVPVSEKEVRHRFGVKQIRWTVDPKLFLVAEIKKEPVAFLWATPDYNILFKKFNGKLGLIQIIQFLLFKNKIKRGKLQLIGVKEKYRKRLIGSYLNYCALLEMKKRGYESAECGWIDEINLPSNEIIEKTGAKPYIKNSVYEKRI